MPYFAVSSQKAITVQGVTPPPPPPTPTYIIAAAALALIGAVAYMVMKKR